MNRFFPLIMVSFALLFAGASCSPCLSVSADVLSQVPNAVQKMDSVVSQPNVAVLPPDLVTQSLGVKAALVNSTTPACQIPGWLAFAETLFNDAMPIILQYGLPALGV